MNLQDLNFPWHESTRLDAHAHLAADVTRPQLERLGDVLVLAMTRSLLDAERVSRRRDGRVLWGCGVHPSSVEALESFDQSRFERLVDRFSIVGEVGLDKRSGDLGVTVLRQILRLTEHRSVLMSLHCTKAETDLLRLLTEARPKAPILHWYSGDPDLVERFVEVGCYFSVNSRTALDCIERVPASRVLTETDFPATRRHGGHLPGATASAIERIAEVYSEPTSVVERRIWENFAGACHAAGLVCPADWPSPPAEGTQERTLF